MEFSMNQRLRHYATALALIAAFLFGFAVAHLAPSAIAGPAMQSESDPQLARFERIWRLVHQEYVEQPVDSEALVTGAINGMLEVLGDRHTSYMPPQEFELFNESLSGSYSGIGAQVEAAGNRLLIVSPFDGSPAQEAGLLPGDEIIMVDDTPISDFEDPLAAITLVRGPAGEPVTLQIKREERTFDVTIVRAEIPLVSASGEMLENSIGYVRVADFSPMTVEQLREALQEVLAAEPVGLVLDLRGNPGGSLDAAIRVTSEFVGNGPVMIEEWGDGRRTTFEARSGGLATDPALPLVVLVDGGSASASEIVAGAIQDRGRGQILGETTFGKGTVQNWHDLGTENGGVRITIARWMTPEGSWIHEAGITPDVEVARSTADRQADRDPQLDAAVALLLGKPLPQPGVAVSSRACCLPQPQ
jgi:carboxyl-terminal processing protease